MLRYYRLTGYRECQKKPHLMRGSRLEWKAGRRVLALELCHNFSQRALILTLESHLWFVQMGPEKREAAMDGCEIEAGQPDAETAIPKRSSLPASKASGSGRGSRFTRYGSGSAPPVRLSASSAWLPSPLTTAATRSSTTRWRAAARFRRFATRLATPTSASRRRTCTWQWRTRRWGIYFCSGDFGRGRERLSRSAIGSAERSCC